jgi:2-C-methyl-D-erythritol 4-phosphate cytidylyltransferase
VKRVRDGQVVETLPREELRAVQTPQGFLRAVLEEAHRSGTEVTDDATLVERRGVTVVTVPGSAAAFKVTVAADLWLAEAYVTGRTPPGWGMPPDWEAPPDRPLPDGHRRVAG